MVTAALLEAVRPLRAAAPALDVERLVARLREQRPDLDAGAEQVGEALRALEAEESEATAAAAPAAAADEGASGAPSQGVSLACVGCGRQLGKPKFQVCPWCAGAKLPATFWTSGAARTAPPTRNGGRERLRGVRGLTSSARKCTTAQQYRGEKARHCTAGLISRMYVFLWRRPHGGVNPCSAPLAPLLDQVDTP